MLATSGGRVPWSVRRVHRVSFAAAALLAVALPAGLARAAAIPAGDGGEAVVADGPAVAGPVAAGPAAARALDAARGPELGAEALARGRERFQKQCAPCHGAEGRGDGPAAYLLNPRPRDFTRGSFKLISTTSTSGVNRDLFDTITRGMPGSAMPPWSHLPEEDRWALVAEVRRLQREGRIERIVRSRRERGRPEDRASAEKIATRSIERVKPIELPPETAATREDIVRGRLSYLQDCASCHDRDGRGRLKTDLKDQDGFPIFARDFTQGVFKGSAGSRDLAYRILAGIPSSPMPGYATNFEGRPKDLWSLVHFIQSLVPEGAQQRVVQHKSTLTAARISDAVPEDPSSELWDRAPDTYVALMPLWWRNDRVEGVLVRALHDGHRLAIRLTYDDPTEDRLGVQTDQFPDGAAMQFSADPEPPFFAMGDKDHPVEIWYFSAQHLADLARRTDVEDVYPRALADVHRDAKEPRFGEQTTVGEVSAAAMKPAFLTAHGVGNPVASPRRKTAVDSLDANGFGTLTARGPAPSAVEGSASWDRGVWDVVFVRPLAVEGDPLSFAAGGDRSIGFAVWDGSAGDRNGQKSVTIWHTLHIEN